MPSSTAVFRAVADFKSLNRGVQEVRREIAALKREASDTKSFKNLDSALSRVVAEQKKLRTQTNALSASRKQAGITEKAVADSLIKSAKASKDATAPLYKYERVLSAADRALLKLQEVQQSAVDSTSTLALAQDESAASLEAATTRIQDMARAESDALRAKKALRTETESLASSSRRSGIAEKVAAEAFAKAAKANKEATVSVKNYEKATRQAEKSVGKLYDNQRAASVSTTLLAAEQDRVSSSFDEAAVRIREVAKAETEALGAARQHTEALKKERDTANSKSGVLTRLTAKLASLAAYERSAALGADAHNASLSRESSSLSSLASSIRGHASSVGGLSSSSASATNSTTRFNQALAQTGSSSNSAQRGVGGLSGLLRDYSSRTQAAHGFTITFHRALIALILPAIPAIITVLVGSLVALGGALVAVIGAAAPAAGAIAALGPAALAAAGGIGVALLAFRGVGAALKAQKAASLAADQASANSAKTDKQQADARVSAAGRVLDAQDRLRAAVRAQANATIDADRQIEDAERSLSRSHDDVRHALADLHAERRQAIRDLEDMRNASEDAALSVESANIALIDAQDELNRVLTETSKQDTSTINVGVLQIEVGSVSPNKSATELEKRKARLAVAEAEQRVEEANLRASRAKDDLNVSEQKGVEGSDLVVAASQRIIDAKEKEMLAERDLLSLRHDIADRQIAVDEAVVGAQRDLQEALQTSLDSTSDAVDNQVAAQTKLNDLLSRMSPEGMAFVAFLESLIPLLDKMSRAAQTALFPGLIEAIKILLPLVDSVAIPTIKAFGQVLADLAIDGAQRLKSLERDFLSFGTSDGPKLVDKFGRTLLNLGEAVWHVTMAAIPLTQWLADLALEFSKYLKNTAEAARESGRLSSFFDSVKETLKLLGSILLNVGGILFSVFKGAVPMGKRLLETFRDVTGETDRYLKSAEGIAKVQKYFDDMEPSIRIIFRLLTLLAGVLSHIGASETTRNLLQQIEEKLVPAMERFGRAMEKVADQLGGKFIDLLSKFLDIISTLMEAGGGGGFDAFVTVLSAFASVLQTILSIPGMSELGSWLLAIAGGLLAIKVLGKLPILGGIGRGLNSLAGGAAAARAGDVVTDKSPRTFSRGLAGGLGGSDVPARTATARTGATLGRGLRALGGRLGFRRPSADVDLPDDTSPSPRTRRPPVVDPLYGADVVSQTSPARRRESAPTDVDVDSPRERARQRIRDMETSGAVPPMRRRLPPVDWAEESSSPHGRSNWPGGGAPPPGRRRVYPEDWADTPPPRRRSRIPGTLDYEEEGRGTPSRRSRPDLNVPDATGESPMDRARRRTREMLAAEDFPSPDESRSQRRRGTDASDDGPSKPSTTHGSFLVDSRGPVTIKSSGKSKIEVPYADFEDDRDHRPQGLARQLGGAAVSTAGAIGGSLAGEAIGQRFGGDTGGTVGSIAGGLAGSFAPEILAKGFSKLGPVIDGIKGKLGSVASTLSGSVSGAARGAVSGVSAIVKPAGELVGHLGSAAGAYIKLGIEAAISAGKQLLVSAAALVVRGALLLWAAAQWILNAALSANPIGIIIVVLALLVGAFIYAWTHSETFRNIVTGALKAVGDFFVWVWDHLLKPVFDKFMEGLRQIGDGSRWLWEHALKPTWEAIGNAIQWVWNSLIKPVFDRFMSGLEVLRLAGWFLWDHGIRPVFDRIGGIINDVWNNIVRPVLDFTVRKFWDTVNSIGQAWGNLKGFLARPINFVIDWVWNRGLRQAWNAIAGIIPGLGQLGPLGLIPEYASGGSVPGTGNRDSVPALLTPGEYVVSKPVVEKWGLDRLDAAHQAARRGRKADTSQMFGNDSTTSVEYTTGGVVSPSIQKLAGGGVVGGISWLLGAIQGWISSVIDNWTAGVIDMLPQPPPRFMEIPRGVATRIRNLTLGWLLGQRAPEGFAQGGPVLPLRDSDRTRKHDSTSGSHYHDGGPVQQALRRALKDPVLKKKLDTRDKRSDSLVGTDVVRRHKDISTMKLLKSSRVTNTDKLTTSSDYASKLSGSLPTGDIRYSKEIVVDDLRQIKGGKALKALQRVLDSSAVMNRRPVRERLQAKEKDSSETSIRDDYPMLRRALGGSVFGSGSRDSVSALLTPGEFVLNKKAAHALGPERLKQLNSLTSQTTDKMHVSELFTPLPVQSVPHFALGGAVTEAFNSVVSHRDGDVNSRSVSTAKGGDTHSKDMTIITNVHNPVAEPASDSVARRMRTLSLMGAFS